MKNPLWASWAETAIIYAGEMTNLGHIASMHGMASKYRIFQKECSRIGATSTRSTRLTKCAERFKEGSRDNRGYLVLELLQVINLGQPIGQSLWYPFYASVPWPFCLAFGIPRLHINKYLPRVTCWPLHESLTWNMLLNDWHIDSSRFLNVGSILFS